MGQRTKVGGFARTRRDAALQREKGCASVMHLMMDILPGH